jgi:hypothetical protein
MTLHAPKENGIEWVTLFSEASGVVCQALIRNATNGALKLWLQRKVVPGAAAEVTFAPGFKESGTILYCRPDGEGYSTVVSLQSVEGPRRENRTDMSEPCVVLELGAQDAHAMPSEVINISRSGMGLRVRNAIKSGALISIALENFIFIGEVRHCAADDRGRYRVGVSIEHQIPRAPEPVEEAVSTASETPLAAVREWSAAVAKRIMSALGVEREPRRHG